MTSANRSLAAEEIRNAFVAGGTNLEAALRAGFRALDGVDWRAEEGRLPALVILTDGQPTAGITDRAQLRQIARDANDHDVNVFAIAFGGDADWSFVHGIAADGDGAALRVPEGAGAEVDIRRFMQTLTTPVLTDVRIAYPSHVNATRTGAPILFAGSELLVVGTFDPARGPFRATVSARSPDGLRTYEATSIEASGLGFLPRVVAYHGIQRIQGLIEAEGERADWVQEVTRLGLRHGYVTDYTSLVVTLDPRQGCADCMWLEADDAGADPRSRFWSVADASSPNRSGMTLGLGESSATRLSTSPTPGTPGTTPAPQGDSAARVPGPGLALVALAAVAAALAFRRRT